MRVFCFVKMCWNCRSKPCFKGLSPKKHLKNPQKLPSNTQFHFGESFWSSKKLFPKSFLCQGFGADSPNIQRLHKKARCAVLFLLYVLRIFSVLKIIFSVTVVYLSYNAAGIANGNRVCGNILCDNTSCSYDRVVSDIYSGNYYDSCADPTVFAYMYGHVKLITFLPELRQRLSV